MARLRAALSETSGARHEPVMSASLTSRELMARGLMPRGAVAVADAPTSQSGLSAGNGSLRLGGSRVWRTGDGASLGWSGATLEGGPSLGLEGGLSGARPGCAAGGVVTLPGPSGAVECPGLAWDEVISIDPAGTDQVYDLTVPGDHNFVAADVVVHNTAFALGMASHAAVHSQVPVLFFSLEMGHLEITQRLLCAESMVDSGRLRNGRLLESDWPKITAATSRLGEAPLYIDDNPNLTIMEVRAKARRLKSRLGSLGLIVIDYLQLMTGRHNAESRQVEIAEMSRGLKILARELQVPVVALSQLSRQLESRQDKRPMLSDLRESGCLTADARVLRADTGAEVTLGELLASGERDVLVWTVGEDLALATGTMTRVFPSGVKPVFALRLASGRVVKASANHPFLTANGWSRLDHLGIGEHLAVRPVARRAANGRTAQRQPTDVRRAGLVPATGGLRDHSLAGGLRARSIGTNGVTSPGAADIPSASSAGADSHLGVGTHRQRLGDSHSGVGGTRRQRTGHGLAGTHVTWDRVVSIEALGEAPVYDATVEGSHNFIANGVVVHNSLEQDADVVMFIYRDEIYNPESNDKGAAEIILAKHRNGPTGTTKLVFQDRYTRFDNAARGV